MKKVLLAAVLACLCLALTACGKKADPVTGYVSGDVTLGEYKNLTYAPYAKEVTETEVETEINSFLTSKATTEEVTDRNVTETGDVIYVDYIGSIDGVPFENGSATGAAITLGTSGYLTDFMDGLTGVEVGNPVSFNVTFPDPYQNDTSLSGKTARFDAKVLKICKKVVPELTDEFVAANTSYTTVDQYKESVLEGLKSNKETAALNSKSNDVFAAVIENATFNRDLTDLIATSKSNLIASYDSQMSSTYGVTAQQYYNLVYGLSEEAFDKYMENQAAASVKFSLVLSAIVEKEELKTDSEEIKTTAATMAQSYGYDSLDAFYTSLKSQYNADPEEIVKSNVLLTKAMEVVLDSAIEKAPEPTTATE